MSFIDNLLAKFFGKKSDRDIQEIYPLLEKIKAKEAEFSGLTADQLRGVSARLKAEIAQSTEALCQSIEELKLLAEDDAKDIDERELLFKQIQNLEKEVDNTIKQKLDDILPDAFALVKITAQRFSAGTPIEVTATELDRELAAQGKDFLSISGDKALWRNQWTAGGSIVTWEMVHYDVQLIGGAILHQGKIAEMATGEGKTLVATLPVFLNALSGRGVHVVTVNDYLAKRDSEWMGPLFQFHGLTIDCIDRHQPNSPARRAAYNSDITYGTNNEFGFDYLRDNMAINPSDLVQRIHNFAIVDEVDSVLIDDARTPLIISGPVPRGGDQMFEEYRGRVEKVYNAQRSYATKILAEAKKLLESQDKKQQEEGAKLLLRAHKGLPKNKALIKFLSEPGMKALLQKTESFYMQENNKNMHIATAELLFIIDEAHNSVELTEQGIDFLSSDLEEKDFFLMPNIGEGIAEIEKATNDSNEKLRLKDALLLDYSVKSERLHTIIQLLKAYAVFEKDVEYVVMDNQVKIVDEQTGRIMDGRRYSDGLHQALEAKERVKVEAATQTFATVTLQNYFRMYKKLAGMTGTAETESKELWDIYKLDVVVTPTNRPISRSDRQDLVYKTKREKYNAVIDHVVELTAQGRPVLVGTTSVEVSELLARMLQRRDIKHNVLNAKLHKREAEIVAEAGQSSCVTIATNMAGRGTDIKLAAEVKTAGGLAIVGTERHESRRVDRQLRGRAGRQGDPGSSQFFVSLEDDLMRMFGSDRIARIMDSLGHEEGDVIQHSLITKSIERAQRKVEENNFGIRKRLLEYDDVMNSQREVVYTRRRHALYGERISIDFIGMLQDVCESLANSSQRENYDDFVLDVIRYLAIECPFSENEFAQYDKAELSDALFSHAYKMYERRMQDIAEEAYPQIKHIFETQGAQYENMIVPFTDGQHGLNILVNLRKGTETHGRELIKSLLKTIILVHLDEAWKEHLRELDELRHSVQNAAYEQKDPLLIYKFESFELFRQMLDKVNKEVVSMVMKSQIPHVEARPAQAPERHTDFSRLTASKEETDLIGSGEKASEPREPQQPKQQPIRVEQKIGRNDPCPCGSGKKYKQCHGKFDQE